MTNLQAKMFDLANQCDAKLASDPKNIGRIISPKRESEECRENRYYDQWLEYFNGTNKIMASMPDLYLAGKYGDSELIEGLRKDATPFANHGLASSTKIIYDTSGFLEGFFNIDAMIVHYCGLKTTKPIYSRKFPIYEYHKNEYSPRGDILKEIMSDTSLLSHFEVFFGTKTELYPRELLLYLQNLFMTNDNIKIIVGVLERLSGLDSNNIKICTPTTINRKYNQEMVVTFCFKDGNFIVNNELPGNYCYTRSVFINRWEHRKR